MSGASTPLKKKKSTHALFLTHPVVETLLHGLKWYLKKQKEKEIVFLNMILVRALTLGFTNIPKFKFIWVYVYIAFLKQQ